MQVAEEADEAAVFGAVHQHLGDVGLGQAAHRRDRGAGRIHRLEILAVELEAPVLARQHGVGLGAGGDQHGAGGQLRFRAVRAGEAHAGGVAEFVHLDGARRQALGEAHAFLHRLGHFLVVQRVGRASISRRR